MANKETNWPQLWEQMKAVMKKHGAPEEVLKAVDYTEWKVKDGKFFLHCPKALYEWIEVPASPDAQSNLRYVKPILWPAMQRLGCTTLIYKLI